VSSESTITPSLAASLAPQWHWAAPAAVGGQPSAALYASPTVSGGRVFLGSNTGVFYALSLSSGKRIWSRDLGYAPTLTCPARGITATASVAADPARGGAATVYIQSATGVLYALDAATGTVVWQTQLTPVSATQNGYYGWSSPTVVGRRVYVGLASQCDQPLVRGGVVSVDQSSGVPLASYWSVPNGAVGASVWTSVAAANGSVYATTGNGDEAVGHDQGDAVSIVRLNGSTMARDDIWTVPAGERPVDADFGGSPTLFRATVHGTATDLVAACDKNGLLYAWRSGALSIGPVWSRRIDTGAGANCFAAPIIKSGALYQAGGATTIAGTATAGSVARLKPGTGAVVWQTPLPAAALGSPALDGAGVLAVPTYDSSAGTANGVYLLNTADGSVLRHLGTTKIFSQPIFAGGRLLIASVTDGLTAYG